MTDPGLKATVGGPLLPRVGAIAASLSERVDPSLALQGCLFLFALAEARVVPDQRRHSAIGQLVENQVRVVATADPQALVDHVVVGKGRGPPVTESCVLETQAGASSFTW